MFETFEPRLLMNIAIIGHPFQPPPVLNGHLTLTAHLDSDSHTNAVTHLTSDPTVSGQVSDLFGVVALRGGVDGTSSLTGGNLFPALNRDGSFTLSSAALQTLAGHTLADGEHTLHLFALDRFGKSVSFDLTFTLKTTPPSTPIFALAAADANAAVAVTPHAAAGSIPETNASFVTLIGHTDP
ncbi:MAG TPA: hypothetical protein VKT70_16005, partial [Stellaceae bacterium]|nr:hypothetical protein [Stellaceae bacterium]